MTWVSGHDWLSAAQNERRVLQQALTYNEQLHGVHDQRRAEVLAQANHALSELTAALLPRLDWPNLQRAAQVTGYTPLVQYNHVAALEQEKARLRQRLDATEQNPDFVHREHEWAKAQGEIAELEQSRRSLRAVVYACDHPRMQHLLSSHYGTPEYDVPFWRLSYYSDWEAGDQILERWPGKTFGEVRTEYLRAKEALVALDDRVEELQQRMWALRSLADAYARDQQTFAATEQTYLARCREHLSRHIVDAGAEALGPRFAGIPDLELLAKRVFGLAAKLTYLDGLAAGLVKQREEIHTSISRADREISKFSRPKKMNMAIPGDAYHRRFKPRQERYQKQWKRFQTGHDRVYVFNRYDRANLASDFLWWDVMTDGELDGNFLPAVQQYHQRHPGYTYTRPDWDDDERDRHDHAAAAFLDQPDDPEPAGSGMFDPS